MSLVGTLGKIAVGVVAAKAASSMIRGRAGGGAGGGLGGMLGNALGQGQQGQQGGGLAGGLGGLLGGGQQGGGGVGGALGGLLGGAQQGGGGLGGLLGGGQQQQGGAGGLGGLLGGDTQQGGAGGLGGLLDSLGGGAGAAGAGGSSLGGMLNAQLTGEPEPEPEAAQEEEAKILIRAMLNSAKCDGNFDASEQEKILKQVGDMSQEDANFINEELEKPLDVQGFIASVPAGMQQQVYLMSILAIDLDSQEEAQYLDQLAKGFGMSEQDADAIHAKLGVPKLYS